MTIIVCKDNQKDIKSGSAVLISRPRCSSVDGSTSTTDFSMRKYQQLALFIISMFSLMAFLYYKHEYERLRYTLEYLDTFGNPPSDENVKMSCHYGMFQRITTPPADWIQITSDLVVYSAFWDDQNGMVEPYARVIAVITKSVETPVELKAVFWYENDKEPVNARCSFEKVSEREHDLSSDGNHHVMYILCKSKVSSKKATFFRSVTPYIIQFYTENNKLTVPIFIQEVERWKTVPNKSAMCILPTQDPTNSLNLIEYISYHNLIGIQKFTIYGAVLTPLARRLLDKYADDIGLLYEEKQFSNLARFVIPESIGRKVIELDCIHRHLDTHESVIILPLNEYILPHDRSNIQDILKTLSSVGSRRKTISEYHLSTQKVCVDVEHEKKKSGLILSKQARSLGIAEEKGVAILYPHLRTSSQEGTQNEQHIGKGSMVVYEFVPCPSDAAHLDTHHLPNSNKFVSLIKNSLLYRKWSINQ